MKAVDSSPDMQWIGSALDAAVDGMVFIWPNGIIKLANATFAKMAGVLAPNLPGMNIKTFVDERHHEVYQHALSSKEPAKPHRLRTMIIRDHAAPLPVEITHNYDDASGCSLCIVRDLSKTLEIEAHLNELQSDLLHMARVAAMNEMGSALAHELNQPLTATLLYLQAAKTGFPNEAALRLLDKAALEVQRAAAIIQRIRKFVEKAEALQSVVDLKVLLDEALDLVKLGCPGKPRIDTMIEDDLPAVYVDHVQIEQVIVNVLRNAFEAVVDIPDPVITIRLRRRGEQLALTIADNGPGVPDALRGQMFKAFSTTKANSLGVGLAISRSIIQNHGGNLELDEKVESRGASFTLTLPLGREYAAGSSHEETYAARMDTA